MIISGNRRLVLYATAFELSLGVFAVFIGILIGHNPLRTLLNGSGIHAARSVMIGLAATLPPLAFFLYFLRTTWRPLLRIRRVLEQYLGPVLERISAPVSILVSGSAGLGEELLFRGVLQASLVPILGIVPALLLSSVVFGLLHWITPAYAIYATVFGLYLGGLFVVTGSLIAPIVTHAAYDAAALLLLSRNRAQEV